MRLARSALPTAATAVVLAALAVPTTAVADGGNSCRKRAKVVDGTVTSIDKATGDIGTDPVKILKRAGQVYAVPEDGGDATVRFQHVTYVLEPGSQFALGCFGESAAEGAKFPRVILGVGELTAKFAEGSPGAVSNQAAMAGPTGRAAMTVHVVAKDFARMTVSKNPDKPGKITVTPYAGPRKGHCRYVSRGAELDARKDTAKYEM